MFAELVLRVAGVEYAGWQELSLTTTIEAVSRSFSVTAVSREVRALQGRDIRAGAACRVSMNGVRLLTGYIDAVEADLTADSHNIDISGRDRTGDLVDSSARHATGEWRDQTILQVASDLCAPFGIAVRATTDVGDVFESWQVQAGESVVECLQRMARQRGLLLQSDDGGNLVLCKPGSARIATPLIRGVNILRSRGSVSLRDRYSEIIVQGQSDFSDFRSASEVTEGEARATDAEIGRYRPLVVVVDDADDETMLQDRALWERSTRAAQGTRVTYTVAGWHHDGGQPWRHDRIVAVRDPELRIDRDMYIAGVTYKRGAEGTTTELECTYPGAFDVLVEPETESFF